MPLKRKSDSPAVPVAPSDPLKLLRSGDQDERWMAARAAASVAGGAKALADALLSESSPQVREAMFTSLTRIRSPESVQALVPLLKAEGAHLRTGALDSLRAMTDVVREYLPKLLSDADPDVRVLSCELARGLSSEVATPMLCKLLENEPDPNVCAAAIDVLSEVGNESAMPTLAECAKRFAATPFMTFAIQVATDRIRSQTGTPPPNAILPDHG